ncbi:ABC transporter ATP-binding protein [Streptomyces yaizuensis]|uniref:ABC transporter ATP-binding protein/permease n=1 Tax=Streptomyces yaizuensis TaxID=2989713 RepID=A0ABQ5NQR3_9ACTN|nr:ABC transporter ATP-binding protein [Streptomyces sp. YSPA8]GLF92733.1 ABC transporter ATP-binding protein/permease [Streptomyces sp. YSPA8]
MAFSPLWQLTVLTRYLRGERRPLTLLALLVPTGVGLQIAAPEMLRRFVDSALTGHGAVLTGVALWYLALAGGQLLAVLAGDALAVRLAWRTTNRLRTELVGHCLRRPARFYQDHPPGELVERVDGDVTRLAGVMSTLVLEVLAQALLVVGVLAALFRLDWRIGLVFAPFVAGTLLVLRRLVGRALPLVTARQRSSADLLGFLEERLAGAEDLRTNGATAHTLGALDTRLAALSRRAREAARASVQWPATVQALSALSVVLALAVSVWLHSLGRLSTGTAFATLSYALLLRRPLLTISTRFHDVEQAVVSARRIAELTGARDSVRAGTGRLPAGPLGLRFDAVSFHYDPAEPVLREVTFDLGAGERLGVVGRTGSGKSTLVRLVFGLHHPEGGSVAVGGRAVRDLDPTALRARVALVTQEVQVFHASLRDNLSFFDRSVTDRRLVAALAEAGLEPWLHTLPDGLDTVLGPADGAHGMSAGQEQLLTLARVFLRDPAVVLLDEPTARLDPHTEALLDPAIERLLHGRTAVVVQHRPHTLRHVDRVLVLEAGAVVEHGPRAALAADPGSRVHALLAGGGGGGTR